MRIAIALAALTATGCASDPGAQPQSCGGPHEDHLAEGGEIRHEHVQIFGMAAQTWLQVYQYSGPPLAANAPIAATNGTGPFGMCVDERQAGTWPFTPITAATYLTLPEVVVTGPGMPSGGLSVVETDPPNQLGTTTFRHYDFTYGGGGFDATLTADESRPGGDYTLDIGKAGCAGYDAHGSCTGPAAQVQPMSYRMPDAYTAPLGIGSNETVPVPADQDLVLTWSAPPNTPDGDYGHYSSYVLLIDPDSATNPPQFLCLADAPGHLVIPAAVIAQLPPTGMIVHGDQTYVGEAREAAPGEMRRFDLVAAYENVSFYSKM